MGYKNQRSLYMLFVKIIAVIAVLGVALLVYSGYQNPGQTAFAFIAFIVSVIALVMTTLQSLLITKQVQITEKAARLVHETGEQLEELVAEDRKLEKEIRQDIKLDHEIIAVLEEFGVGEDEDERREVAARITKRVAPKQQI